MHNTVPEHPVVVIGLGDIGGNLASALATLHWPLLGVRRSAQPIAGVPLLQLDAREPAGLEQLPQRLTAVVVCITPDDRSVQGYRDSYLAVARAVAGALASRDVGRLYWVGSTSVYGPGMGEDVIESTPPDPQQPRAQVLLDAEQALAQAGCPVTVLRLTGVYGPGRTMLLRRVLQGRGVAAQPPQWSNRVHRDDAVAMLRFLLQRQLEGSSLPPLVLGSDGTPVPRHEVLAWLAQALKERGVQVPDLLADNAPEQASGRRVWPHALQQMGFRWRYPDYRAGFTAMLDAMAADGTLKALGQ